MAARYNRLSAATFVAVVVIVLATFQQYGASWDEKAQQDYGGLVLRFYLSLGLDRSSLFEVGDLYHYGGFFELLSVLATRVAPFGVYETRHLLTALCGIAGIFACWKISCFLAGPRAAFFTTVLLSLYPSYYGHMFINSKDIPFAVFHAWSLYYLIRLLHEFPDVSWPTTVRLGVVTGLTMGIRVGGLILICYLYLFAGVLVLMQLLSNEHSLRSMLSTFRGILTKAAAVTLIAYALMLLFWPYGLAKPFIRPFTTLQWFSAMRMTPESRDYVPRLLMLKLPELVLVLLVIGLGVGFWKLARQADRYEFAKTLPFVLLIFSSVFPIVYAVITQPPLYDEVRHFLFVIPPLFCLAGITMDALFDALPLTSLPGRLVLASVSVYLLIHVRTMVELHPYEYSYYNRLIAGVRGAFEKGYETDYWATSYKEGVQKLRNYLATRDGDAFEQKRYKILVSSAESCATPYFPANFLMVTDPKDADLYFATTRGRDDTRYTGTEIVSVRRYQVPFMVVKTP